MPFLLPNQQRQSTEGTLVTIPTHTSVCWALVFFLWVWIWPVTLTLTMSRWTSVPNVYIMGHFVQKLSSRHTYGRPTALPGPFNCWLIYTACIIAISSSFRGGNGCRLQGHLQYFLSCLGIRIIRSKWRMRVALPVYQKTTYPTPICTNVSSWQFNQLPPILVWK